MYRTPLLIYLTKGRHVMGVKFTGDKNAAEHDKLPEKNIGGSGRFALLADRALR